MKTVPEREFTLRDFLRVLDRRRSVVVSTFLISFALVLLACIVMTRRYEATGVVQLEKSMPGGLELGDMMGSAMGGGGDSLSENVDLQTKASILQSDTLALKVINQLDLEKNPDFKPRFRPLGLISGLISPHGPPDPANAPLQSSPRRRAHALEVFRDHLKVKVIPGTRLIEVDYSNPDPNVAAGAVNDMVQALIDFTFQTKYAATSQVSDWLSAQLGDLRAQSEDLASKVAAMQKETGLFGIGATDLQGKPVIYSPVLDRLQASTSQLSTAQMNDLLKESVYKIVKTGNAELISELSGTSLAGTSSVGVTTSLSLIQQLRGQEATLQAQIANDSAVYGADYPKLVEEQASLARVKRSVQDEIERIGERAKNDAEVAHSTLSGAQRAYNADRAAAEQLNDKAIKYTILAREADQSEQLYQDLLKHLKEAGILESLHATNLTFVDRASPPSDPSRPKPAMLIPAGLVGGLFLGVGAAFLIEAVDTKIRGIEEIEALNMKVLGILPEFPGGDPHVLPTGKHNEYSGYDEAVRRLRSTLLISRSGNPPQVILVTSAGPAEGKSTTSMALAIVMAQYGRKVLLVEADMRRPVLRGRFKRSETDGLSLLLTDADAKFNPVQVDPNFPTLDLLLAGPIPPYPSELIGSDRMAKLVERWRSTYDFIIMDCPPVLPVTDTQVLEPMADATVIITRVGYTSRVALDRAYKSLAPYTKNPDVPNVGVVLNFVGPRSAAYYGYYGYYGSTTYDYKREEGNGEKH